MLLLEDVLLDFDPEPAALEELDAVEECFAVEEASEAVVETLVALDDLEDAALVLFETAESVLVAVTLTLVPFLTMVP